MRARLVRTAVVALVAILAAGCAGQPLASRPQPTPNHGCPSSGLALSEGCWQEILPLGSGGFPAIPGSQNTPLWQPGLFPLTMTPHIAYDDALWMVSQTRAYSSPDGLTWTEHHKTDWGERIYESIVYFKGRLWMLGGLDYQASTFLNDIWSSPMALRGPGMERLPGRNAAATLWWSTRTDCGCSAGANHIADDRSTDGFLNDVWVSEDGIDWTQVTPAAPWSPRDKAGAVVFNNELYLVGGQGTADVWRSSNGHDWTRLSVEADWGPRHDFARVVYDGRMWVFGGWKGGSTNAVNDVWYSRDGRSWSRQTDHAPWAPRSPIVVVFHDKIWIYSGKHTGADDNWGGDFWQMTSGTTTKR